MEFLLDRGLILLSELIGVAALLGLAVFTFLQRARGPGLGPLVLVAAGLGVLGLYGLFDAVVGIANQFLPSYGVFASLLHGGTGLLRALAQAIALLLVGIGLVQTLVGRADPS